MQKNVILRPLYYVLTVPFFLIGKLAIALNIFDLQNKLNKCIEVVDIKSSEVPDFYISYLVAAEDHRSSFHFGVDHIGMTRAMFIWLTKKETQGASTIEQQFVRVVTGDYTNSLLRKFKEQLISVALTNKRSKKDIAKSYLAIAYYGYSLEGTNGIAKHIGGDLMLATEKQIVSVVARLKYPEPSKKTSNWSDKYYWRTLYINRRYKKIANKKIQRTV